MFEKLTRRVLAASVTGKYRRYLVAGAAVPLVAAVGLPLGSATASPHLVGSSNPTTRAAGAAATDLRVMTWNIHRGVPTTGPPADLERIADVVRTQNPDVVALQEVRDDGNFPDQPATLKTKLQGDGYEYSYFGISEHSPNRTPKGYKRGQLILSKFPISGSKTIPLPTTHAHPPGVPNDSRTSLVRATVAVPGIGHVRVYSTHLSPPSGRPQVKDQLDQIRKILDRDGDLEDSIPRLNEPPSLLVGDFNIWPVDVPGRSYSRNSRIKSWIADRGFIDTWTVTRPSREGVTLPPRNPGPEPAKDRRIDYVFASPVFDVLGGHLSRDHGASDHRAVVMDLRVSGPPLLESGSLLAGESGEAGWAQLAVDKGRKAKLTVCKNQGTSEDNGWTVRARVYNQRTGEVYRVQADGGTSRDMCQTTSWGGVSRANTALQTCLVKGDMVKECHKRTLFHRRQFGPHGNDGRAGVRVGADNDVTLRVCGRAADGWGVQARVYDPGTDDPVAHTQVRHGCAAPVRGAWSWTGSRLVLESCLYKPGHAERACRQTVVADER